MAEGKEPTFGSMVLSRAWFAAWEFFESKVRDAIIFLALFAAGGLAYYFLFGFPATKEQVVPVLIFTVGPIVALWVLLFAWHLWLAPSALAYEAARQAAKAKPAAAAPQPQAPKPPTVNWAIWRQRSIYDLSEFAAILAKIDPSSSKETLEKNSFERLLAEDGTNRKLAISPGQHVNDYDTPDLWPSHFNVQRADALKWAQDKGFDVSHIA